MIHRPKFWFFLFSLALLVFIFGPAAAQKIRAGQSQSAASQPQMPAFQLHSPDSLRTWQAIVQAYLPEAFPPGPPGLLTDKTYWGDGIHQEVCLFYWYGCETCFEASKTVYPLLKEKLPSGIKLHYLPLVSAHPSINANLEAHARMALTLQAMGKEDGLSEDLYKLIAGAEGKILITPEAQADFLAGYGVSREQYLEIWNSAQTDETIRKLKDFQEAKGIDKVPKAVINGSLYYNINTKRPDMTVSKIIEQLKFGRI